MTLEILTSDTLAPLRHGFFTRNGGVSTGLYDSLNCGLGSDDERAAVLENRARVATAMGLGPEKMAGLYQIHSAECVTLTDAAACTDRPQADAYVTALCGVGLAILTADCLPVLFCDPQAGVIGAAHAGWRGALDGVLEATLEAMEALGAQRADTVAVIGPTISQRAYEVGPEFLDAFMADDIDNQRFFANGQGDRYLFDLPAFGLHRLRSIGVGHAEWTRHCPYGDPDRFYSYRRSTHRGEADYGRLISAIGLPKA